MADCNEGTAQEYRQRALFSTIGADLVLRFFVILKKLLEILIINLFRLIVLIRKRVFYILIFLAVVSLAAVIIYENVKVAATTPVLAEIDGDAMTLNTENTRSGDTGDYYKSETVPPIARTEPATTSETAAEATTTAKPDDKNDISFDSSTETLRIPKGIASVIESQEDDDANKTYVFAYKGTVNSWQSDSLNGEFIKSVSFDADKPKITIKTDKFSAFDITEDNENFYIKAISPRLKYDKIIMIDPGHGGDDYGAIHGGENEKDIAIDIAIDLYNLFKDGNSGIKAYMTRYDDETVDIYDRPETSNSVADMFVSIHCNTFEDDTTIHGVTVYYDPDMTNEIGRFQISNKNFALSLSASVTGELNANNRGIIDDYELVVLDHALIPAALVEVGYMTNAAELKKLADPDYQQSAAKGAYNGIIEAFDEADS